MKQFDRFTLRNPLLWWPVGHGDPFLYTISVQLEDQSHTIRSNKVLAYGLRTIELIQEPLKDSDASLSFFFRINGRNVFIKGANWIPTDSFPSRFSEKRTKQLLRDAVTANMNMVRVWGGGNYETDYFYETCDQLGLLVWQEMMFACSM